MNLPDATRIAKVKSAAEQRPYVVTTPADIGHGTTFNHHPASTPVEEGWEIVTTVNTYLSPAQRLQEPSRVPQLLRT